MGCILLTAPCCPGLLVIWLGPEAEAGCLKKVLLAAVDLG